MTYKTILFNMDKKTQDSLIAQVSYDIECICQSEPEAAQALAMTINHIAGTYSDKYADGEKVIDTKKMLYGMDHGAAINIYQVTRYLQRYITVGHNKSRLIRDLEKPFTTSLSKSRVAYVRAT